MEKRLERKSEVRRKPVPINLHCTWSHARRAFVLGDFTDWEPLEMKRLTDGNWFVQVNLVPGNYHYVFLVDGELQLDPNAAGNVMLDDSGPFSLLTVS
jgi:hypothetical protein